jgi:hypothetical protein
MFETLDTTKLETICGGVWTPPPWVFSRQGPALRIPTPSTSDAHTGPALGLPKLSTTDAHSKSTTFPPPYTAE